MSSREILESWFRRVWQECDASAIDEMFAPDGRAIGLGDAIMVGPEDFKQFHQALLRHIQNVRLTIDHHMEQGEWISVFCSLEAVGKVTREVVRTTGCSLCRLRNGQIVEAYNYWDFMTLFSQLGLLPENAFMDALTSEPVRR